MQFEAEYKKLNTQQQAAVDQLEGPVLVIAGPGTGKTQLLSMRTANILKKTDTDARNVLCLTFTNKAATNMRERLNVLTSGEGNDVTIKTFHAFAADIMNSHPEKFWNGANLESAPESVQLDILQTIFDALPKDNTFTAKFDGKYTQLRSAAEGIKLAKEAGLTPKKLRALLQFNLAYIEEIEPQIIEILSPTLSYKTIPSLQEKIQQLPTQQLDSTLAPLLELVTVIREGLDFAAAADSGTGKTKHIGEWKKRWLQTVNGEKGMFKIKAANQRWLLLADIYEQYRQALHQRGYYDYSDMLLEVIVQLEQDHELRSDIQEQYNYVLVDEFQDSNAAQLRLAHLVSDHHSANGLPNIMAVGDDDQSIYGFNGAELNNLLYFERNFEKVTTIVLTENYRSSQAVLDTAEKTIDHCQDRLVTRLPHLTKHLVAKNEPSKPGEITHWQFDDVDQQYSELANEIAAYTRKNPDQSIAVLARQNSSLIRLASLLNSHDVPLVFEKGQNVLELEAVVVIQHIFEAVSQIGQGDSEGLSQTLSLMLPHPMWGISSELLWKIAQENRYQTTWLEALAEHDETQLIGQWLEQLAKIQTTAPLEHMLEYVIGLRELEDAHYQSPLRMYFIENQGDAMQGEYLKTLSGIRVLRRTIQEATSAQQVLHIDDWLEYVRLMQANKQILADQSVFITGENAVQLLSVHKSKGLEFDRIYIIDAQDTVWKPKAERNQPPANIPLRPPLESMDDYARLMYVALTRAKRDIIITSFCRSDKGEEVLATPLITHIEAIKKPLKQNQKQTVLESTLTWPRLKAPTEKDLLRPILQTFTLNATNLINFLDLSSGGPDTFVTRNLLRLPSVKSESMSHGTAVHSALELAQKQVNLDAFDFAAVTQEYRRKLTAEQLPPAAFERQVVVGERVLTHLFNELEYQLPKGSIPERSLQKINIGDAVLGGKLDRIDIISPEHLRIVDYKTGAPLASFDTKDKTKVIKAWKHTLQLTFYALLATHHPDYKKYTEIEGQMVYVEAHHQKDLTRSYVPSPEDIQRLEQLIQAVWHCIQTYQLPDVSAYSPDIAGIRAFEEDLLKGRGT